MTTATNIPEPQVALPKKRYEWIDNSRVVAAFLIMCVHLPLNLPADSLFNNEVVRSLTIYCVYAGRVAVFLMLSGYLFGRNASWAKTWDRFLWLVIPYMLWNLIIWGGQYFVNPGHHYNFFQVMGFGAVFDSSLTFTPCGAVKPCLNAPSWYMRDMLPLTLLTPLFVRFKKYLPLAILVFVLAYHGNMRMKSEVMMAPSTICFYLIGICLTRFKLEDGYKIFTPKLTPFVIIAFITACATSLLFTIFHRGFRPEITLIGMFVGAMMIAHCGVAIERNFPTLSKKMAPLGPASFLIFMCHWPVFQLVALWFPALTRTLWILLLPFPTFVFIAGAFLLMKRYTPWLMPYLGHMKIKKKTPGAA